MQKKYLSKSLTKSSLQTKRSVCQPDYSLHSRLYAAIGDRQLTTALEYLERRGISGDLAIFVIANLQSLGVAV